MTLEQNNEVQQKLNMLKNFKFDVDDKTYQKVKNGIQIKSNFYLERVNNWIIVSSGAMFSILWSGIDKNISLISTNMLRDSLAFLIFIATLSIIQKIALTIYRVKCEQSVHKFERHFAQGSILASSISELPGECSNNDNLIKKILKTYRNYKTFNWIGQEFSRESNDTYIFGITIHRAILVIMCIQGISFFGFMCIMIGALLPK
jgi:hypothetical protein